MDWLKKILEAQGLTAEQIKAITEGVEGNYKGYVPEHRFKEITEARNKLEEDLKERDKQLTDLKKSAEGNEALQIQIKDLQEANKTASDTYTKEMKDLRTNTAIKLALAGHVHDPDIVLNLMDKSKIELDDNGNVKAGFDDQIKALKTNKTFLFKEPSKGPAFKGITPVDSGDTDFNTSPELQQLKQQHAEAVKTRNMPQQIAIKNKIHELQKKEG